MRRVVQRVVEGGEGETNLDGQRDCIHRRKRSRSSARTRRRRRSHTCCPRSASHSSSSGSSWSDMQGHQLGPRTGGRRGTHEVEPLLLELVKDDLKDFVRDCSDAIASAFGVDVVEPDLVCGRVRCEQRAEDATWNVPCSSISYSTCRASSDSIGSIEERRGQQLLGEGRGVKRNRKVQEPQEAHAELPTPPEALQWLETASFVDPDASLRGGRRVETLKASEPHSLQQELQLMRRLVETPELLLQPPAPLPHLRELFSWSSPSSTRPNKGSLAVAAPTSTQDQTHAATSSTSPRPDSCLPLCSRPTLLRC